MSRFLPLMGMSTFFFVGFFLRAAIQYMRHGHTGLILFKDQHWRGFFRDLAFMLLASTLFVQALVMAIVPETVMNHFLMPHQPAVNPMGGMLVFGGIVLMLAAQLRMGVSWRVGIDESARPGLVTGGLYRLCRNPIYLALFTVLAGMLLMLPTLVSLLASLGVWYCIRTQTLQEEAYLLRTYGDEYRAYAASVGRYVPGVGKLELP